MPQMVTGLQNGHPVPVYFVYCQFHIAVNRNSVLITILQLSYFGILPLILIIIIILKYHVQLILSNEKQEIK